MGRAIRSRASADERLYLAAGPGRGSEPDLSRGRVHRELLGYRRPGSGFVRRGSRSVGGRNCTRVQRRPDDPQLHVAAMVVIRRLLALAVLSLLLTGCASLDRDL